MMVYLFNKWKKVRQIVPENKLAKLIHKEAKYTLDAELAVDIAVHPGEYLGFRCVDGRFRLFEISATHENDKLGVVEITATDAIIAELKGIIIEDVLQLDASLKTAIRGLLPEEWEIVGDEPDRLEKSRAYYATAWTMLQTFEQLYEWRIIPYYRFEDGKISGRVIELMDDKPVFRGRILRSSLDAKKVYVSRVGKPVTRLYGLGPSQGTRDVQTNLTFADVEWSVANGDPVDKPKGQTWVNDPAAEADGIIYSQVISITDAEDAADLLQKTYDNLQKMLEPVVNAEAIVADMEMVPGQSHKQIRLGDLAALKTLSKTTVEARIIDIERDYLHKDATLIKVGNKSDTITGQVADLIANATHTFERLTVYQNRFVENENLIMLNADHIQLNADYIKQTADEIEVLAKEIELKADTILLEGYVKADELETDILEVLSYAEIPYLTAIGIGAQNLILTNWLEARSADVGELLVDTINGQTVSTQERTVLTGIGTITQNKRFLNLALADGGSVQLDIVTDVSITPNTAYIKYLGEA